MANANFEINHSISKVKNIICRTCPLKFSSFGKPKQFVEFDNFNLNDVDDIISILSQIQYNTNIDLPQDYVNTRNKLDRSLQRLLNNENN